MVVSRSGQPSENAQLAVGEELQQENENAQTLNHNTEEQLAADQSKTRNTAASVPVPSMVVTPRSVRGTNAANHVGAEPSSDLEHVRTLPPNMAVSPVSYLVHQSNEENAKLNPVLDTLNSVHGPSAPNHVQAVYRSEQGNVMLLDGLVLSIARILGLHTRRENVKLSLVPSTVCGVHGLHGALVPSRAAKDRRQRAEYATRHPHNMEEPNVQATTPSKLCVRSNRVQFMVDGLSGTIGELAVKAVAEENKFEPVSAATRHQNTVERHAQAWPQTHVHATRTSVPSMEVGLSGACGENVRSHVGVDERTDFDDAPTPHPNMVVNDAQEHQSKRNNVGPSNVRSMENGVNIQHTVLVRRVVVGVQLPVTDIVTHLHPSTTVAIVQAPPSRQSNVTPTTALLTANTHHGPNGQPALHHVVEVPRPETESAHHQNMEAKVAKFLDTRLTNKNVTQLCVQ